MPSSAVSDYRTKVRTNFESAYRCELNPAGAVHQRVPFSLEDLIRNRNPKKKIKIKR
jgi:hypothetical protein